jgi:HSP20 family protein
MVPTSVDVKKSERGGPTQTFAMWPAELTEADVWHSFRAEMDRVVEHLIGHHAPHAPRLFGLRGPVVDIVEDETAWRLRAELPGLAETDVEVVVSGQRLTVRGEKRCEQEAGDRNYYISERGYGGFTRSFTIPESVDHDRIDATLAHGVLTVTLPKRPGTTAGERHIEIKPAT